MMGRAPSLAQMLLHSASQQQPNDLLLNLLRRAGFVPPSASSYPPAGPGSSLDPRSRFGMAAQGGPPEPRAYDPSGYWMYRQAAPGLVMPQANPLRALLDRRDIFRRSQPDEVVVPWWQPAVQAEVQAGGIGL